MMSMEVTNNYEKYNNGGMYAVKKNEHIEKKSSDNVQSSKDKVQEYYEKLCKKFPQISFNTQGGVMPCSPGKTVVNLSPDCLKKMANDPEFAKEVEWNLSGEVAANSLLYSWAKRDGVELGGPTVKYDANGNREASCGGMRTANVGNGNNSSKIQKKYKEEQERWIKARKKREEKEKAEARIEEKRREKQEFQERMEKMRSERVAYLERFNNANGSLGSYQSIELSQTVSFFDENA